MNKCIMSSRGSLLLEVSTRAVCTAVLHLINQYELFSALYLIMPRKSKSHYMYSSFMPAQCVSSWWRQALLKHLPLTHGLCCLLLWALYLGEGRNRSNENLRVSSLRRFMQMQADCMWSHLDMSLRATLRVSSVNSSASLTRLGSLDH